MKEISFKMTSYFEFYSDNSDDFYKFVFNNIENYPNDNVRYYLYISLIGNKYILNSFINNVNFEGNIQGMFEIICAQNYFECFEMFVYKPVDFQRSFEIACIYGSIDIVELFFKHLEKIDIEIGIAIALKYNHYELLNLFNGWRSDIVYSGEYQYISIMLILDKFRQFQNL